LQIGFVTYATGPYNDFVDGLWSSLTKYAFVRHDVHLFVFTDRARNSTFTAHPRLHLRHQERLGWPFDSLARHFLYLRHNAWYRGMDFVFSVDSDALLVGEWDERLLGERVGALSAWPYASPSHLFTDDRRRTLADRPYSSAFLDADSHSCYFAGGVFGGTYAGFVSMLRETTALASEDLSKQPPRVALWHDESYINAVFVARPPTVIMGPNFVYPEAPADEWLFADTNPSRDAWLHLLRLGGVPKLLNLGVRKHLAKTVDHFQPTAAMLPRLMSAHNQPEVHGLTPSSQAVAANVTFIVKAFERSGCLTRLLDSVAASYPGAPVIVLDDSGRPLLTDRERAALEQRLPHLRYIRSAFDVGLAAGRNALVDEVKTPFVLLLDDDFILEAGSGIERLLGVLERGLFDLAGGCIDSAHGYSLLHSGDHLEVRSDLACAGHTDRPPLFDTPDLSCWEVDMINNFFLARTDFLRQVRWDPRLK
jgi:hypothetical protein